MVIKDVEDKSERMFLLVTLPNSILLWQRLSSLSYRTKVMVTEMIVNTKNRVWMMY